MKENVIAMCITFAVISVLFAAIIYFAPGWLAGALVSAPFCLFAGWVWGRAGPLL